MEGDQLQAIYLFPGDNGDMGDLCLASDPLGLELVLEAFNAAELRQVWDRQVVGIGAFVLRNRATGSVILHADLLPRQRVKSGYYYPRYLFADATWEQVAPAGDGGGQIVCVSAQQQHPPLNFLVWGQNPAAIALAAAADEEQHDMAVLHAEEEMILVEVEAEAGDVVVEIPSDPGAARPTSCCGLILRRLRSCFGCL